MAAPDDAGHTLTAEFQLNKSKALRKKLDAANRSTHLSIKKTGGGLMLTFSAAMFDVYRRALLDLYKVTPRKDVDCTRSATYREVASIETEDKIRYTVQMFLTKSKWQVQGDESNFLETELGRLQSRADKLLSDQNCSVDQLNEAMKYVLSEAVQSVHTHTNSESSVSCPPVHNLTTQSESIESLTTVKASNIQPCVSYTPHSNTEEHKSNGTLALISESKNDIREESGQPMTIPDSVRIDTDKIKISDNVQINDSVNTSGNSREIYPGFPCSSPPEETQVCPLGAGLVSPSSANVDSHNDKHTVTTESDEDELDVSFCSIVNDHSAADSETDCSLPQDTARAGNQKNADTKNNEPVPTTAPAATADTLEKSISSSPKNMDSQNKGRRQKKNLRKRIKSKKAHNQKEQCTEHCLPKCKFNRKETVGQDMIKCCLCMIWFHDNCVGLEDDSESTIWHCPSCRNLPNSVASLHSLMQDILTQTQTASTTCTTNQNLVSQLAIKTGECENLTKKLQKAQAENSRLQETIKSLQHQKDIRDGKKFTFSAVTDPNINTTSQGPSLPVKSKQTPVTTHECLLLGDCTIEDCASYLPAEIHVSCLPGAGVTEITKKLESVRSTGARYNHIILQVGTVNCTEKTPLSDFRVQHSKLLDVAKTCTTTNGKITVSSITPRTDNVEVNDCRTKINKVAEENANKFKLNHVNHDLNFTYANGEPDQTLLKGKGVYLSDNGTKRLLANLDLPIIDRSPRRSEPVHDVQSVTQEKAISDRVTSDKFDLSNAIPVQGAKCKLSMFHPFRLQFSNISFDTPEHCLQFRRARASYQDELAYQFTTPHYYKPGEAKRLADAYIVDDPDWDGEDKLGEQVLKDILELRAEQDPSFCAALLDTNNRTLIHTVPDKFWGSGSYQLTAPVEGKNRYGVLLMGLRDKLKSKLYSHSNAEHDPSGYKNTPTGSSGDCTYYSYKPLCDFCGMSSHMKDQCRYDKPLQCFSCYGYGHKAKQCYNSCY